MNSGGGKRKGRDDGMRAKSKGRGSATLGKVIADYESSWGRVILKEGTPAALNCG